MYVLLQKCFFDLTQTYIHTNAFFFRMTLPSVDGINKMYQQTTEGHSIEYLF